MDKIEQQDSVYVNDETIYNKKIKQVDPPGRNIGIDIDHEFLDNIISAGLNSTLDMAKLQSFTQLSQNRETIYQLIDTMSEDPTISAALEIYAEDTTEANEFGRIVWCESENPDIVKFVTYLLDTMNVEKNIYKWVYSLCKYGDLYLRLFRESEMEDSLNIFDKKNKRDKLNEDVKIHVDKKDDHFSHYIEMVPNPAEMFELTRHGKSCGYIKADVMPTTQKVDMLAQSYFRYQFREKDVTVYEPTNFVHACLEDNSSRVPEEVDIFLDNNTKADADNPDITYTVRRGQPIFYNAFKVWRCMMLLENSLLLNRITKSSILRIIGVEVGDMDKTSVGPHLMNIKQLIEQKAAFDVGNSMEEYTNPGPVENNIYVPTHNGIGAISTQQVGGDVDVKGLADLDYFQNRFYTALRVPKQYIGDTDDATGFNGGTALSIISNRYAKMIKRIQNIVVQCLTDVVNLMIIDKGNDAYINNFTLHMLAPATEEEATRRDNRSSELQTIRDIMDLLSDMESVPVKLEILKTLLANVISDADILQMIQDEIDRLEQENPEEVSDESSEDADIDIDMNSSFGGGGDFNEPELNDLNIDTGEEETMDMEEPTGEETVLPTPNELNPDIDFSDNTTEI